MSESQWAVITPKGTPVPVQETEEANGRDTLDCFVSLDPSPL